jgi:hypothetical protein
LGFINVELWKLDSSLLPRFPGFYFIIIFILIVVGCLHTKDHSEV